MNELAMANFLESFTKMWQLRISSPEKLKSLSQVMEICSS